MSNVIFYYHMPKLLVLYKPLLIDSSISLKLRVGRKRRQRRNCRHPEVDLDVVVNEAKRRLGAVGARQPQVLLQGDPKPASRK